MSKHNIFALNLAIIAGLIFGYLIITGAQFARSRFVTQGSDGDSTTVQSDSGLEMVNGRMTLLRGCADNEIVKWDETADDWNCESEDHDDTVNTDTDSHTQYVLGDTSAGDPAMGACTRDSHIFTDTTGNVLWFCSDGASADARSVAGLGDAYNQISDGSTAASASGNEAFHILGGVGITNTVVVGSPDQITVDITNHIKSIAPGVSPVGGCSITEEALAANKPTDFYVTCTDADADQVNFSWPSPDSWTAGTVTVEIHAVNINASPSGNLVMHCSGDSVGNDDVIPNQTTTGQQAATITFATQYDLMHATTSAITLNGTPAAGDVVFMHCDIDATLTTTTQMTDVRIMPRPKVEYTVTGGGSD